MASELTPAEILNATQQTTHTATPRKPIETWQSRTIKAKLQALAFVHHQDYTHATPRAKKARRLPSKLMSTLTSAEASSQRPDSPSPRSNAASGRPSVECTPQSPSASATTEQVAHMLRLHPSRKAKNRDWGEERPKWKLPLDRCISPNAIIMPYLPGKELWDLVVMVLVTYTAFQVPLTASFFAGDPSTPPAGLVATMWLIDVVFLADIAVCLRTAYVSEAGNLVTSPRLIRRRYVRSWLALDVLGTACHGTWSRSTSRAAASSSRRTCTRGAGGACCCWRGCCASRSCRATRTTTCATSGTPTRTRAGRCGGSCSAASC